ncbi:CatB-related O-acetyltransferase [Virgibacillus halodenitrificans]|uniref:CatB-related O-acetyltransferase n=1 Tax=Virgibacillus halodenitrificans TaxID=1482 RepID=UPI002DBCE18F|nr:CatB-related O-acetyltransferase [Virgibacillus halodenitrificans]MEC2159781.1 CatB-related O-acetyltransferase [Virgibacillus halodenitrificans]
MKLLKQIVKKALLIFYSLYKKDLNVDYSSEISRIVYKNLKGNSKYKIVVKNSFLSGNIIAEEGCKFLDVTCTGNVKLGRFVSLNGPATRISSRLNGIEIGSFSSIASNVVIQEDYHRSDKVSTYFMNRNIFNSGAKEDIYSKGKIKIEEDVWIGSNSTILSGITIGRGSIIGAGSVVTKDIPRYSIVAGNPAKVIRKRFSDDIISKLELSRWWEFDIKSLKKYQNDLNKSLIEGSKIFEEVLIENEL